MAKFITTSETIAAVESIIKTAKTELVLISPYLQLSEIIFERLKSADLKGVPITFVYGKDELKSEVRSMLAQLKGLKLYYYKNLHAKCYYNDHQLVISSMNLYEFSGKHNREMGVLIYKEQDADFFYDAVEEAQAITNQAVLEEHNPKKVTREANTVFSLFRIKEKERIELSDSKDKSRTEGRTNLSKGICIRCGTGISFDPERPLCYTCYQTWSYFGNPYYVERFCHLCNAPYESSLAQPLCFTCNKDV